MTFFKNNPRLVVLLFLDIVLSLFSFCVAFYLRFDGQIPPDQFDTLVKLIPFILACRIPAFFYFGLYTRVWEYSSLGDLTQIIKAVITGSFMALFVLFMFDRGALVSRSILIIDAILLMVCLGGARLVLRFSKEMNQKKLGEDSKNKIPIVIMGAGSTGVLLLRYIRDFSNHYKVVGFLDNDPKKLGRHIQGLKILGKLEDIPNLKEGLEFSEVFVAINGLDADGLSKIVEVCEASNLKYKIVSSIFDLSTKQPHISQIRNIEITDLLGREPVFLDLSLIKKMIMGKRVLVTGAGGSIGSELCRQLLEYEPSSLIALDRSENYLHELSIDLNALKSNAETDYYFGSVTDLKKMETIFSKHQPQLVFHAAAHKHVPLMEKNPHDAIINNVLGTKQTADLADKFGAEKFILVSTDKVVNPTSVMGMTKKIAEIYVNFKSHHSSTQFISVRFGNVLGSNGSVVPIFKKQIERGGPVTVTHPDMERYFMLIAEAVQLILQAITLGEDGETFVLEMGKPVKLINLAEKMIRLLGYVPNETMEIKITGIRPGEKLFEELIDKGEKAIPTQHKKIKRLKSSFAPGSDFENRLTTFIKQVGEAKPSEQKQIISNFISVEYKELPAPLEQTS